MKRLAGISLVIMLLSGCGDGPLINPTDYYGAAVIQGQIRSLAGDPIPGVEVTVIVHPQSCADGKGESLEGSASSKADGSFRGEFGITSGQPVDFTSVCTEVVATPPEGASFGEGRVLLGTLRVTNPIVDTLNTVVELGE